MSNTIRRKNQWQDMAWTLQDYVLVGLRVHSVTISEKSIKGRVAIAKYHSDAGSGSKWCCTAPRWYRRYQHKRVRRKADTETRKFIKGEVEDVLPISNISNASWYY